MAQISLNEAAHFCNRMATAFHAGLDHQRIWEMEVRRAHTISRPYVQKVAKLVQDGSSLADAFRATDGYFPPLMCEMVAVGEQGGRLNEAFQHLAQHYDHLRQLRTSFIRGIAWPMFELAFAIFIMGGLILILGFIGSMNGGEPIDVFMLGLSPTGNFFLFATVVILGLGSISVASFGLLKGWFGPTPLKVAHYVPVIGATIQMLAMSRLSWALGMAIDAGMDAVRSAGLALRASQNPLYISHSESIENSIQGGTEMFLAFNQQGIFPEEFVVNLESGEMTGQVTENMTRYSDECRQKANRLFATLTAIGGFLVTLLVMAAIVAVIFFLFTQLYLKPMNEALELTR